MARCKFRIEKSEDDPEFNCELEEDEKDYCCFHSNSTYGKPTRDDKIRKHLDNLVADNKDLNLTGFKLTTDEINIISKYHFDNIIFKKCKFDKVSFENKEFNNVDFYNSEFKDSAIFSFAKFKGKVSFKNTTFHHVAYFSETEFKDTCDFSESKFILDEKNHPGVTFYGTGFYRTKFKNIDFSNSIFKQDIEFNGIKIYSSNRNSFKFYGCQFNSLLLKNITFGNIEFSDSIFNNNLELNNITINGEFSFERVEVTGTSKFECGFNGEAHFSKTKFNKKVNFSSSFNDREQFCSYFNDEAQFKNVKFLDVVVFENVEFEFITDFSYSEFLETPLFSYCKFHGFTYFNDTVFHKYVKFDSIKFTLLDFSYVDFYETDFINCNFNCDLYREDKSYTIDSILSDKNNFLKFIKNFPMIRGDQVEIPQFLQRKFLGENKDENVTYIKKGDRGEIVLYYKNEYGMKSSFSLYKDIPINFAFAKFRNKCRFIDMDLSKVSFKGTELSKVEFHNVKWLSNQDSVKWSNLDLFFKNLKLSFVNLFFGHNIVIDEKINTLNYDDLIYIYNQLKKNLDADLRFSESSSFFIGEFESIRKKLWGKRFWCCFDNKIKSTGYFIYRMIGNYGESIFLPLFFWTPLIIILSWIFRICVGFCSTSEPNLTDACNSLDKFIDSLSASFLIPQSNGNLDILQRIISFPFLGAGFIALKRRFERAR